MFPYPYYVTLGWKKRELSSFTSRQGNDVYAYADTVWIPNCVIYPRTGQERKASSAVEATQEGRNTVTTSLTAHIPTENLVGSNDVFEVSDVDGIIDGDYEVEGDPSPYNNPYTNEFLKVINMNRVKG